MGGCFNVNYTGENITTSSISTSTNYEEGSTTTVTLSKNSSCKLYTEANIYLKTNNTTTAPIESIPALKYKLYNGSSQISEGTITNKGDYLLGVVPLTDTEITYTVYLYIDPSISIGNYNDKSYSGYIYATSNQTSTIEGNYLVSFDEGNIYHISDTNSNGLEISYDKNTQILTLNGQSTSSSSGIYLARFNSNFVEGDKYAVTLTYISGTFTGTGYMSIEMEIENSSGAGVSPRNNIGQYIHNLESLGSVSKVVTITSAGAEQGTQYQFWIWLQGGASNYSFDNYKIKVNYSKISNRKNVTLGQPYGWLPIPERVGYTFKGWNGKNLINTVVNQSAPSSTTAAQTTSRTFIPGTYVIGLAYNNYYNPSAVTSNSISMDEGSLNYTANGGYGIGYPLLVDANSEYTLSFEATTTNNGPYVSTLFYKENGEIISYENHVGAGEVTYTFTTPADTYYLVVVFAVGSGTSTINLSNIQLEKGTTGTVYEPYYVTSSTNVTQNKNHTLTAIWEQNN